MPAVVFLGNEGTTRAERWLGAALRAAAVDLTLRLGDAGYGPILAVAADPEGGASLARAGARLLEEPPGSFHFGRALAAVARGNNLGALAYFGGGSAPLATADHLAAWRRQAADLPADGALVNNLHSSDWAILRDTRVLSSVASDLPTDNALGWVLPHQAGVAVRTPEFAAASRTDVDTPGDLALIRAHEDLGPELRRALDPFPESLRARAEGLGRVLRTPGSTAALIGRVSAEVWQETVRRTQVWLRVYAEERGMRASGRQERGEVRSLVAEWVDEVGPRAFLERIGSMADGLVWDTRVWMAHAGRWPSDSDRAAADLGWADDVKEPSLRRLTEAVAGASIPVVTGGHGVVAGSLLALLETLAAPGGASGGYQPSR